MTPEMLRQIYLQLKNQPKKQITKQTLSLHRKKTHSLQPKKTCPCGKPLKRVN
ncbi:hypothetical protein [Aeribacillus alveayuensis]|uniref:Uncharacterized protein n=1 Tax=Aeribacillus alveayuensis TaxID=279215 RepID=A0ABT9VNF5_9BACI|nr:hypothetical protein [Bacillus alveayuensis]